MYNLRISSLCMLREGGKILFDGGVYFATPIVIGVLVRFFIDWKK